MSKTNIMIFGFTEDSAIYQLNKIKEAYDGCNDYTIKSRNEFIVGNVRYHAQKFAQNLKGMKCDRIYYEKGFVDVEGFLPIAFNMTILSETNPFMEEFDLA